MLEAPAVGSNLRILRQARGKFVPHVMNVIAADVKQNGLWYDTQLFRG